MFPTLALLLTALSATPPDLQNLDFTEGLSHWKGEGFEPLGGGVSSMDRDGKGRKAILHRTFVVPPGAGTLHFSAHATATDERLNVYLEAAEREILPKRVRTAKGFERVLHLSPADKSKPREYVFSIADRVGETLRIIVLDHDDTPGQSVWCGGFRMEPADQFETREFVQYMNGLVRASKLSPMGAPFRSKHFVAVGNTHARFITTHLERSELMYEQFLSHFRAKGFQLKQPVSRLMVAILDNQEGLEAYIGERMSSHVSGLYHPPSNRLVVYDFARNRALVETQERFEVRVQKLSAWDRAHQLGRMHREAYAVSTDTNIATIMHETAHLMCFNTGLLNRDGDLPLWMIEGLATYCEATENGAWRGIGEVNPERLKPLRYGVKGEWRFLPLRSLVESDKWLRAPGATPQQVLMGYAQSWALVRMLMEEQPKAVKRYCELIHSRKTPEHRLADFAEVFGANLAKLEKRHRDYIQRTITNYP